MLHSSLSGSSVNESCAQDTEQMHGKQFFQFIIIILKNFVKEVLFKVFFAVFVLKFFFVVSENF